MTGTGLENGQSAGWFRGEGSADGDAGAPSTGSVMVGTVEPDGHVGSDGGPARQRPLRVLALTKIFPNARQPLAAAFNRQQFAALARRAALQVVVPVQWFPGAARFGDRTDAGKLAQVPAYDWVDGMFVRYPRVFHLPRIDYPAAAGLYWVSLYPLMRRLCRDVDVVLGSFLYPDGVAAVWMARALGLPSVVYALGTDVNLVPEIPGVPAMLRWTLPRTNRIVAVSRDLAGKMVALGAPADRVSVIPNGVDREIFHPRDRAPARAQLGQPEGGRLILYVGRLERAKGIDELLSAFDTLAAEDPTVRLAIVGDGALRARCDQAAAARPGRLLVPGGRPLPEVACWMAAADLLVLPSWHEGTPNVIIEALASGRPVVASDTGGIPDLLDAPTLGERFPPRDVPALTAALRRVLARPHDPAAIAARGAVSWGESADQLLAVLASAAAERGRPSP
jgi:teichuronic acid biosynthesis glycosyltransferase TuaC